MSTNETNQAMQQQPPATDAAGGKSEVNRSVSWTDLASGFAELRARAMKEKQEANELKKRAMKHRWAYHEGVADGTRVMASTVISWLDELEADAKDETQ